MLHQVPTVHQKRNYSNQSILGCDPGSRGAICYLNHSEVSFIDLNTPLTTLLMWIIASPTNAIYIEQVRNIHGVSSSSNFKFGYNYGYISGILSTTGTPIRSVQPKVWQKYIGVTTTGGSSKEKTLRKNEIAEIMLSHYPEADIKGKRGGVIDGRSDALAIAHYGLQQ